MENESLFFESHASIKNFVDETYLTLKSSGPVPLQRLEEAYIRMNACIHEKAAVTDIDFTALGYVFPRLPEPIVDVTEIIFGQSSSILSEFGFETSDWKEAYAPARRRRYLYDGQNRLVVLLSSKSDIDDVIPTLIAFQIEWNKIHNLISNSKLDEESRTKLKAIFGEASGKAFSAMEERTCCFTIKNCESSYSRYRQETDRWWENLAQTFPYLSSRRVYFVSSNTHSLINLLSGFAECNAAEILRYGRISGHKNLAERHKKSKDRREKSYLLYLILKKYEKDCKSIYQRRIDWEERKGIYRHYNSNTLDVTTQIIDLKKLSETTSNIETGYRLPVSLSTDAVIINIDYPLGRTAYFILSKLSEHVRKLAGIYVIGKAASLFAERGDVVIPTSILDQQTKNHYYIQNCFSAKSMEKCFSSGNHGVYEKQKAVTVLGTFLQNNTMMNSFQKERIMDIEMEAGPYLSAYYEITNANRYPEDETVILSSEKPELGILHYISDNPRSCDKLDKSLAWEGTDATYATTTAVLNRIMQGAMK